MSHVEKDENFGFAVCWLVVTDLFLFFSLPSNLVEILLKILRQLSDFVEKLAGAYCLLRQLTSKVCRQLKKLLVLMVCVVY